MASRQPGRHLQGQQHTIFQVSSVSKSISAKVAAFAMTKDHSFDWDTPVGKVWDGFHLNLDYVSGDHRRLLRPIARPPMAAGDGLKDLGLGQFCDICRGTPSPLMKKAYWPCWDVILPWIGRWLAAVLSRFENCYFRPGSRKR